MAEKLVKLAEFQTITGLSDSGLLWLLTNNRLDCRIDEKQGILIDIHSARESDLLSAILQREEDRFAGDAALVEERFASLIADNLDSICREAIARYLADGSSGKGGKE